MSLSRRDFIKGSMAVAGAAAIDGISLAYAENANVFPSHPPLGAGQGIKPGRVVWTHDPQAVHWDGVDYWWKPENFSQQALLEMLQRGIMELTGQTAPTAAWQALFEWRNRQNGSKGGYQPGQKLAIKTNMNGAGEYNDDPTGQHAAPYGNPLLLQTLLLSLVDAGKVAPIDITVFDTCRIFPDYMRSMCSSGQLKGVQFRHRDPGGPLDAAADRNARYIGQATSGEKVPISPAA